MRLKNRLGVLHPSTVEPSLVDRRTRTPNAGGVATEPLLCSQCLALLDEANRPRRGGICVPCRRENGREHYRANREYYVRKARDRTVRVRTEVRAWLLDYLGEHPCIDCGVMDPRVLEFDHRDPDSKVSAVAVLAGQGWSLASVAAEVAKCDVRCANCHRIRTVEQLGWWRAREDSNL